MARRYDKVISGGRVVTPREIVEADVAIRGEKIAAIGPGLAAASPGAEVIPADGCYVLPGAIDAHVHLQLPVGGIVTSDDFRSGARAAARGGVTTIIDFATPGRRLDGSYESLREAVDHRMRASGRPVPDRLCLPRLHHALGHASTRSTGNDRARLSHFQGVHDLRQARLAERRPRTVATLEAMREQGGLLLVHAESSGVLDELIERYHKPALMRRLGARLHPLSRPNFIEAEAVQRAIAWSEAAGGPLYIVHMSTGEAADLMRQARQRGALVLGETCPHYLVLTDAVFSREDGHLFATCPQIKKRKDGERLWQGLRDGEIAVAATDTCTFTRKQKARWRGDFTKIPMGLPGVETLFPLLYTQGVRQGRLTLERLVEVIAANPAKIMGLYPRKGVIGKGSDADLTIVHPKKRFSIDPAKMETNADWSPYEGWRLAGFPRTVLSRGEVIVDDYRVMKREGRGQWLPRKNPMVRKIF
jgi:dihydropyrimidinase